MLHNKILQEVLTNHDFLKKKPSEKELVNAIKASYIKNNSSQIKEDETPLDSIALAYVNFIYEEKDVPKMVDFLYEQ